LKFVNAVAAFYREDLHTDTQLKVWGRIWQRMLLPSHKNCKGKRWSCPCAFFN